MQLQSIDKTR